MRMQSTEATCGAAALYNALCAIGKHEPNLLETAERVCKTTAASGTSVRQLVNGAKQLGGLGLRLDFSLAQHAVAALYYHLARGHSACIVVDDDAHWAAVVGSISTRLLVADSADLELVLSLDEPTLCARWRSSGARKPYCMVVI